MLLSKVKVRNFLSVKGECELPVDRRVSVLLGANDHGKSNLLKALKHVNLDAPLVEDDVNWDSKSVRLDFSFVLDKGEIERLRIIQDSWNQEYLHLVEEERKRAESDADESDEDKSDEDEDAAVPAPVATASQVAPPVSVVAPIAGFASPVAQVIPTPLVPTTIAPATSIADDDSEVGVTAAMVLEDVNFVKAIAESESVIFTRDGVGAPLSINGRSISDLPSELEDALKAMIPRVEIFEAASGELQDSVTSADIKKIENEFLQGIFFYAGLNPMSCDDLFVQDDETDKTLEVASEVLDGELRRIWAQGVDLDLHFQLKHRGTSIELLASDPAVKKRQTRMSKRSAGVTQFFRLSMVLHARRKKNPANSYIYVFDEPGVFLHPKGQKDLLAVFEQLAQATQIVYATHSLFMLNQNFPERHRLITKSKDTTLVDSKPYRANWRYAVDALGVRLTANILFSPNILLVEGDSDPIYIYELFRVLNHLGEIDADANLLGIMSYGDLPNLRFLLQTFKAENNERKMTVLFDGDSQGKQCQKQVGPLCKALQAETQPMEMGLAIEDYCLYPALFLKAVEKTLRDSFEAQQASPPADIGTTIQKSWEEYLLRKAKPSQKPRKGADGPNEPPVPPEVATKEQVTPEDKNDRNAGNWFKGLADDLTDGSSKVALARNYAFLARENEVEFGLDAKKVQLAKTLLTQIITNLALPSVKAKQAIEV
jgi:predicted ATPase